MDTPVLRENDRYRLLEVIGEGGMGMVYRAVDKNLSRPVAIKMLKAGLSDENSPLARFQREIETTAQFSHPNIVTVYGIDEFDGSPCMVMEYLEGQSISQMIKSHRPIPIIEKIGLLYQVCDGLQYAHERGVIHRDMKPANVLVHKGVAKIVDFGIARANSDQTLTRTGQAIGSLYWMSPEQVAGTAIDARTDIYSTGVTLFEFLTGEVPFKAPSEDQTATALKILNDPVPSLGKYLANYPVVLDEILQKAMAKNREARYQSIDDLGSELLALQESLKRGMVQEFLGQSRVAIERRDWERARQLLQEIRTVDRKNSEANELRKFVSLEIEKQQRSARIDQLESQAQIALSGSRYEEALECIAQALILNPDNQELLTLSESIKAQIERARQLREALRRGQAALYTGDLESAAFEARNAIAIDGSNTEAQALEDLIRKELDERERRGRLQGLLEDARGKIANHDYLGALRSLQKAQEIDPEDSNIHGLIGWAERGHEQEKLRNELQRFTDGIGQLISKTLYAEALSACGAALQKFPQEPSLLKLQTLAKHQSEIVARRRAVDRVGVEVRGLVDAGRDEDALALLEQELKNYPGDQSLEMLISIVRAESEQKRQQKEERARQEFLIAEQRPVEGALSGRQEALDLLRALQRGLSAKLPMSQLRVMAERVSVGAEADRLNDEVIQQFSGSLAEFKLREAQWSAACQELDEIYGSIRRIKGSLEVNSLLEEARVISEKYAKDEEIQRRYQKIRQFAEEIRLGRETAVEQLSALVRTMQARQDLPLLFSMQKQVQEASAAWLGDALVRDLVNESSAYIQEAQKNQTLLLEELAQLRASVLTARSASQIRMLEDQARVLSADSDDPEVQKAFLDLQGRAKTRLQESDSVITQLREIDGKVLAAKSLAEAESHYEVAQKIVLDGASVEETRVLLRKIERAIEERRKEYRRISRGLESLTANSVQAADPAELDLILAKRRDLLRKYSSDPHFSQLERQLETAIHERREYLVTVAESEADVHRQDIGEADEETDATGYNRNQIARLPASIRTVTAAATDHRIELDELEKVHTADSGSAVEDVSVGPLRRFRIPLLAGVLIAILTTVALWLSLHRRPVPSPAGLTIHSAPGEAWVKINRTPSGFTDANGNFTLQLSPGTYLLEVGRDGFESSSQTFSINLGEQDRLEISLKSVLRVSSQGSLLVKGNVGGAKVIVDGTAKGFTEKDGMLRLLLESRPHSIQVTKPGYADSEPATVTISNNLEAQFPFLLKPTTSSLPAPTNGNLAIHSTPVGASVRIDNDQIGNADAHGDLILPLRPGLHTVEVTFPGYQSYKNSLRIKAGDNISLAVLLSEIPHQPQPPQSAQIISFLAAASKIEQGQHTTLAWSTVNATQVSLDDGSTQTKAQGTGSIDVSPSSDTTYILTAIGSDGRTQQKLAKIIVVPKPVSLTGNSHQVDQGQKAGADLDAKAISGLLEAYQSSFENKDLIRLRHIWPTLSDKQFKDLSTPFRDAQQIRLTLQQSGPPQISGDHAIVSCSQSAQISHDGTVQSLSNSVTFSMRRLGNDWIIEKVAYGKVSVR